MAQAKENLISGYAFLLGVAIAVAVGLSIGVNLLEPRSTIASFIYIILVALGLIVGYLNTGGQDSTTFLFASLALVIVGGMGSSTLVFLSFNPVLSALNEIVRVLLVLFVPATVIAALKVVFSMANIH